MTALLRQSLRVPMPLLAALLTTAGLILLMQQLVQSDRYQLSTATVSAPLSWVRVPEQAPPKREPPIRPPMPESPPETPIQSSIETGGGTGGGWCLEDCAPVTPPPTATPGQGPLYRELVMVFTPKPDYPQRPLERGIEGRVLLRHSVSAAGAVMDVEVLESEPPGVFDRAAISAAERTRYQPRMENGVAVTATDVVRLILFEIGE